MSTTILSISIDADLQKELIQEVGETDVDQFVCDQIRKGLSERSLQPMDEAINAVFRYQGKGLDLMGEGIR